MSSEVQLTGVEHPMLTDESIIDIAAMQSWEVDDDALSNDVLELARAIEQAVRAQWAAEVERLETDNAICRDAIGHALELVEAFAASPEGDDDMSQGAARATRRRLNEALGKMVPRLMMERELSPKYGLHWKALRAERDSAQAEAKELLAQAAKLVEALAVYADPGFYHACSFMFDRPTGGFDEDFEYSEEYRRLMPGKTARAALAALQPGASQVPRAGETA